MSTRQAIIHATLLALLFGLSACSAPTDIPATATATVPPPTSTVTVTPSPIPPTATPTPLGCLTQPGTVEEGEISVTNPPQKFLIYLPPCYTQLPDQRYPVLYLLHGQTFTQDQWVRLGVPQTADRLIHSDVSVPFIVVFPDDRYWNLQGGAGFGDRLINVLIPYIDENYRTIADRDYRSLGGLSRGGGWTMKLGFERPDLFGSLGLHSPAVFKDGAAMVERVIRSIPEDSRPRLWLDVGDADSELASILLLEEMLTRNRYFHEFHFYAGNHSEVYWGAHVEDYLLWYIEAWNEVDVE